MLMYSYVRWLCCALPGLLDDSSPRRGSILPALSHVLVKAFVGRPGARAACLSMALANILF